MARGMVNNEPIVSQAQTKAFDEGYARTFGDRKPQRGRWVWDAEAGRLVNADEYVPPAAKSGTGIMSGRCHEGMVAPDGTDISTRAKRKAWMAATGNADYSDFEGARRKRAAEQAAKARGEFKKDPALREQIGRELYKQKVIL
jgi:hypothetical protein